MHVCAQKIFSKLPKDIFVLDWLHFRSLHGLSCFEKTERARGFCTAAHCANLHFRYDRVASVHSSRAPLHGLCHNDRGKVLVLCKRGYAGDKQRSGVSGDKKSLVEAKESPYAHLTPAQKVKEAGKDVTYLVVIAVGIAVTGLMFYMIGSELFSSQSPSGVYGDALKKCQNSLEVTAALGEPLKGYGETTRRGRRRHVSHTEFEVNGVPHMRMRFYIEGPYRKATVHVEVQKNDSGKYDYRYLVVETEGYPHRTFVLEDNR